MIFYNSFIICQYKREIDNYNYYYYYYNKVEMLENKQNYLFSFLLKKYLIFLNFKNFFKVRKNEQILNLLFSLNVITTLTTTKENVI